MRARSWILAASVVAVVLLIALCFNAYRLGSKQLEPSWGYLIGSPAPQGSLVHILQLLSGPKKGIVRLESVEVGEYEGMELLGIELYRGGADDVPYIGEIPLDIAKRLRPIRGSRLLPNTDGALDYVVMTFRMLEDDVKGPFAQKIKYRWFGIPFEIAFQAR